MSYDPAALVARVRRDLVGMERESEVLAVALATGRHVVLEGPPGTGKSTLLRTLSDEAGHGMCFVEGNAELTPSRLVGYHDPALVLQGGYRPEAFVPGPLVDALQHGRLLYLEEMNRIPEESLNVLITALAEGELNVPRYGRIPADPAFRLIAAMNPFDVIGTARIGQAIYDRLCRIAVTYQDEAHEKAIVHKVTDVHGLDADIAVRLVRATRGHADVRVGSSVRGAIDMTLMSQGLRELRRPTNPSQLRDLWVDAALAALSGRIRLDEACDRRTEDVIVELLDRLLREHNPIDDLGKADGPDLPQHGEESRGQILTGEQARKAVQEAGRRTHGRRELEHRHPNLSDISPDVRGFDGAALQDLLSQDVDAAATLLADLANATDRQLRAEARKAAARLFLRLAREGRPARKGIRRLSPSLDFDGDLDLDLTLARTDGRHPRRAEDLVTRRWSRAERAICLLIDRSGSMHGPGVAMAAVGAASVLVAAGERADCSVIAFAKDAIVLQEQGRRRTPTLLLDDILTLRGKGVTDLALALRAARRQLGRAGARERVALLLSDAKATSGADPLDALRGVDRLHVLGTSADEESVEHGRVLARRGGGNYRLCTSVADLPRALTSLLDS